jgi:hypothetical protein
MDGLNTDPYLMVSQLPIMRKQPSEAAHMLLLDRPENYCISKLTVTLAVTLIWPGASVPSVP